jgi:hypothetical protein
MKVEILTVVKMTLLLFWVVTSRVLIGRYNIAVSLLKNLTFYICTSFTNAKQANKLKLQTSSLILMLFILCYTGRGERIHSLASVSRPALGPTQPPVLSPGVKRGRGVTLTTHPHVVPRTRMSMRYIFSFPWRLHSVAGRLYFIVAPHTVPNDRSANQ